MKEALKIFLILGLTACASPSQLSFKNIAFPDIENLEPGRSTKDQVLTIFGKPNQTRPRSATQEAWIYDAVLSNGAIGQKASFSFDGDILVGALWMPYESDSLENAQAVKDHFKGAKFTRKVKGWDKKGHSYSDHVNYYDPEGGILFTTMSGDRVVSAIGFNLPDAKRDISAETSKK